MGWTRPVPAGNGRAHQRASQLAQRSQRRGERSHVRAAQAAAKSRGRRTAPGARAERAALAPLPTPLCCTRWQQPPLSQPQPTHGDWVVVGVLLLRVGGIILVVGVLDGCIDVAKPCLHV